MNILVNGSAGQGIQLLSLVLANILKDNEYNVALTSEYSPLMRSGDSIVRIVFDRGKIENPIPEDSDIEYDLNEAKLQSELLKKYSNEKVINMTLIGVISKKLKLKINNAEKYLPKKFLKENLEAIKKGYET